MEFTSKQERCLNFLQRNYVIRLNGIGSIISGITYFISAIAGISLFIAGVGIMNMMYISVSEREKEMGIRLSVGATKNDIMFQFLFESMFITIIGGIIGFILGAISSYIISLILPFKAIVSINSMILAFIISTLIGLIFGIFPAKNAANKNLIDILK